MKPLVVALAAVLALSCSGGGESPTSATSHPGVLQLSQRQIRPYDGHEPGPTPAPTFNGTYSGSATRDGSTSFRIAVTVTEAVITGTLGTPPGAEVQGSIPLSGSASADGVVSMTAIDDCGASLYTLTGSITIDAAGVATMAGTYTEAGAAGCAEPRSGTWTAARMPAPSVNLTGIWTGTVTPTIGGSPRTGFAVTVSFQHVGDRLTGDVADGYATLELTGSLTAGTTRTFSGTLSVGQGMSGSMTIDTIADLMTGTFSGINTDGLAESNSFTLQRQ